VLGIITVMDIHFSLGVEVLVVLIVAECVWLYTLVRHLTASCMEPNDKICWTVVLCVLNLLGLILYWTFASTETLRTEEDIKRACNEGRL